MRGFTLIELMISISIIAILTGLSAPVGLALKERNDLVVSKSTVVQALRHTQLLSQSSEEDVAWSVQVGNKVVPSGLTEVVFAKFSGLPQTLGTITLTLGSVTEEIIINEEGMLEH